MQDSVKQDECYVEWMESLSGKPSTAKAYKYGCCVSVSLPEDIEVRKLQGRHLKNIVRGVAVIGMTRGKTNRRYTFFLGAEALEAIREYKPELKDDEYIFIHRDGTQLRPQEVDNMLARPL